MNILSMISAAGSGMAQGAINTCTTIAGFCFAIAALLGSVAFYHVFVWSFYMLTGNDMAPLPPGARSEYVLEHARLENMNVGFHPIEEETGMSAGGYNALDVPVKILVQCTILNTWGEEFDQSWWVTLPAHIDGGAVHGGTGNNFRYTGPISQYHCTAEQARIKTWWKPVTAR